MATVWIDLQPWAAPAASLLAMVVTGVLSWLNYATIRQERIAGMRSKLYEERLAFVKVASPLAAKVPSTIESYGWALRTKQGLKRKDYTDSQATQSRKALVDLHEEIRALYVLAGALMPADYVEALRRVGLTAFKAANSRSSEHVWKDPAETESAYTAFIVVSRKALNVDALEPKILLALGEDRKQRRGFGEMMIS